MVVTLEISHEPIFWLNDEACWNMPSIIVTLDTFQEPMFWLNEVAPRNIPDILVIFETSQEFILLTVVNDEQYENIF